MPGQVLECFPDRNKAKVNRGGIIKKDYCSLLSSTAPTKPMIMVARKASDGNSREGVPEQSLLFAR